jgi:hypothetical protein
MNVAAGHAVVLHGQEPVDGLRREAWHRNRYEPSWPHDPSALVKDQLGVENMLEHLRYDDQVKACPSKGKVMGIELYDTTGRRVNLWRQIAGDHPRTLGVQSSKVSTTPRSEVENFEALHIAKHTPAEADHFVISISAW